MRLSLNFYNLVVIGWKHSYHRKMFNISSRTSWKVGNIFWQNRDKQILQCGGEQVWLCGLHWNNRSPLLYILTFPFTICFLKVLNFPWHWQYSGISLSMDMVLSHWGPRWAKLHTLASLGLLRFRQQIYFWPISECLDA